MVFIAVPAGCSHAARVSVMSSATHDRQTANIRSLLERQKPHASSSTRPKAQAMAAAVATSRPRSSQQGSISARDNKEAQINRERTLNDDRPSRDHLESGATRVSRQSTSAAADSRSKLSRQAVSSAVPRQGPGGLDFGAVPTLDLSSGLENMQSDLSGLVTEFKQQGGFWKEGSLQDNISNMVQLGVKGALGLVSPIGGCTVVSGMATTVGQGYVACHVLSGQVVPGMLCSVMLLAFWCRGKLVICILNSSDLCIVSCCFQ